MEELNPQIIGVVGAGQAERKTGVVLDAVLVHARHVERRIGHHEVELAQHLVRVFVIGVGLADVAG